MLVTFILAAVIGQAPQAQWYPMTNQPGWEGYGVPNGGELIPTKWREASKPEKEWVMEWKEVLSTKAVTAAPTPPPVQTIQQPVQTVLNAYVPAQAGYQPAMAASDPWGFTGWLNATRAAYGLSAVGYDSNLSNWAAMNNDQQANRGIGHHVYGPARRQNSAMGAFANIGPMWMNSPAHRAALLDPTISAIGIAGLGAYWTFNAY